MVTINISECPAFGVALLSGIGTGVYKDAREACRNTIHVTGGTEPIKENVKRYEEYYKIYHTLYQRLKDEFASISKV
jgi:xylulokinase